VVVSTVVNVAMVELAAVAMIVVTAPVVLIMMAVPAVVVTVRPVRGRDV
jgi:hypothetical protein